jgi:hypothetical protein
MEAGSVMGPESDRPTEEKLRLESLIASAPSEICTPTLAARMLTSLRITT